MALALIAGCSAKEEKPAPPPLGVTIAPVVQKDVPIRQEWVGTMVGNVDAEIALSPSRARQIVRGTTQLGGGLSGVRPAVEHSVDSGLASYLEIIDAQIQMYPAERSAIIYDLGRKEALVNLYRALGGGWNLNDSQWTSTSGTSAPAQSPTP